ncbi:MAG: 3-phosphoshikimate 1-carboxyvinyltransferase [Pseudomonadota bacterium]|nr:3-phosphoshikimate 1-carboxyvinyltransferase [Pseudomonadota bacterium]
MGAAKGRKQAFAPRGPLRGTAPVPGDKSISHRALIVAGLAVGCSHVAGLCDGLDLRATGGALAAMGVGIAQQPDGAWSVAGVGVGGLLQPQAALRMGNSGTSARLLAGLVASHRLRATFTGDRSLSRRPMERVAAPLRRIGAGVTTSAGGTLPMLVEGLAPAVPRSHRLSIASAQLKSALLLAGLNTPGVTEVREAAPTRDHLERLLKLFGAEVETNGDVIRLTGEAELIPQRVTIPGDASAAAFLAVAALVTSGSEVRIENVGMNPRRTGLLELLREMDGDIVIGSRREAAGEPVADLTVRHSALRGLEVPPELVPTMIDEFPILFIAAAFAQGTTRTRGLAELRVKESDRLAAMAEGLRAVGARVEEHEDGLTIHGSGGEALAGGAALAACGDHRVAMSFAVAGLHAREPIEIDDMDCVNTSFPGFTGALAALASA